MAGLARRGPPAAESPPEYLAGEARIEGADARVEGNDQAAVVVALQCLAHRGLRLWPALEVACPPVVVVVVDVVDEEHDGVGYELKRR